jgi:hypothetical protein
MPLPLLLLTASDVSLLTLNLKTICLLNSLLSIYVRYPLFSILVSTSPVENCLYTVLDISGYYFKHQPDIIKKQTGEHNSFKTVIRYILTDVLGKI